MKKYTKFLIFLPPFILSGSIVLFKNQILKLLKLTESMPDCALYTLTHKACPGCGGTRSVKALISGDILLSLRYNVVPVFFMILGILFYIELITHVFGKHKILVPRSVVFLCVTIGLFFVYFIARNFIPFLAL